MQLTFEEELEVALREFSLDHGVEITGECLHYTRLEQEELNDPPEAPVWYDELKSTLMSKGLWAAES